MLIMIKMYINNYAVCKRSDCCYDEEVRFFYKNSVTQVYSYSNWYLEVIPLRYVKTTLHNNHEFT